ncbi:hypothetical protein CFP56_020345 [Quercus suber]|uniref:Uncharacterized protein n=1 Tax=Quercus suber TaxID=58331 RepID=A0AAW0KFF4_QUESU
MTYEQLRFHVVECRFGCRKKLCYFSGFHNSHTILAKAGEASTGKALYPYNCLPPTLRHPFQIRNLGNSIPINSDEGMSKTGDYRSYFSE